MVEVNGSYHLFYSGGPYSTASNATGVADCDSPLGPCFDDSDNPVLTTAPGMEGPGGTDTFVSPSGQLMMAFAAWHGAIGYANGGYRAMFKATLGFRFQWGHSDLGSCQRTVGRQGYGEDSRRWWLLAGGLRRGHFLLWQLSVRRFDGLNTTPVQLRDGASARRRKAWPHSIDRLGQCVAPSLRRAR